MSREQNLVKNSIIYLIGNFGSKFLGIILLPLYTHYLNQNQFGYFDLVSTFITLLTPLVTFQITDALFRYLLESKDNNEASRIITNCCSVIVNNLILMNLIIFILFQFTDFDYQYLFLIQFDISVLYSIWIQTARGLKQNILFSISGFIYSVVFLTSNLFLLAYLDFEVNGLILSSIIASAVTLMCVEYKLRISKFIDFKLLNRKFKLKLMRFSLPLMPNVVSWWVMNASDRSLLNYYLGMDANGIYAIANKFPSIMLMLNSIFSLAWQESVITENKSKDSNEFYSKMFNHYLIFQFTGVIIFLAITKMLMRILVDNSYYISWGYIPFLYLATIFSGFSSFYGASYLSSEKTIGSFYTSVIGAVINVVFNICLIPLIGIQGASLATMLSFLAMWVVRIMDTRKYFKITINIKNLIVLSVLTSIYTWLYFYEDFTLEVVLFFVSIVIFVIYNKNILMKGLNVIFSKVNR